jgi:Uma2 family endonuclease
LRIGSEAVASALPKPWTVDDFLAWEAQQPERYEFIDGMVLPRIGGSAAHAAIKDNVTAALRVRLKNSTCRVLSEGLKVVTPENVHYPDVTVFCSPIQPTDDQIHEPVVIVEVLSRSTGDRDRGAKWVGYRTLPSLQHYVRIAQDRRRVEVYTRSDEGWTLRLDELPARRVSLSAIHLELDLDQIYEDSGC